MAITLGETFDRARILIDDVGASRFKDQRLCEWTNEAVRDIARRVPWYRTSGTVSAVDGTQSYSAPTGCLIIHDIRYVETGTSQTYTLERQQQQVVSLAAGTQLTTREGKPGCYWTWGYPGALTFGVFPTPNANGTFTLHYYGIPTALAVTDRSTAITIPDGYESAIVHYVAAMALAAAMRPDWITYKQMYEQAVAGLEEQTDSDFTDQPAQITDAIGTWGPPGLAGVEADWC